MTAPVGSPLWLDMWVGSIIDAYTLAPNDEDERREAVNRALSHCLDEARQAERRRMRQREADMTSAPVPLAEQPTSEMMRSLGWSVAVHNDYRFSGQRFTFWLFTHPSGCWVKGEGETDDEVLAECLCPARATLQQHERLQAEHQRAMADLEATKAALANAERVVNAAQVLRQVGGKFDGFLQVRGWTFFSEALAALDAANPAVTTEEER